jgi:DNA-binding transcriptional ArsR family regulator
MESARGKTWTVERLQDAIKATFFARGLELQRAAAGVALPDVALEGVSLRYTELKRAIQVSDGPVADRTLSHALSALVANGHLRREERGRAVLYTLTIPTADHIVAFARSDASAIENAAEIGGITDLTDGWAYYGLPPVLKDRLQPQLRRAANAYRKEILDMADRFTRRVLREAVRKARGRLSPKDLRLAERALYDTIQLQATGWLTLSRGALLWSNIETMIPGALKAWQRVLGLPDQPDWDGQWTETDIEAVARALGTPSEQLERVVEKEMRKMERSRPALERFFQALGPEETARLGRELSDVVVLLGNLTAVVRP